jgi:superfamily II DNA or RNA helicase
MAVESAVHNKTPRVGMLAKVRNRRGVIASVEPFDGAAEGRLHFVRVEYTDSDGITEDTILWEREESTDLLEPHSLPRVEAEPRMDPVEFDALVRATRWGALRPFLDPDGSGRKSEFSISSPFFGAVQVDDFQLVPLLQALRMPRVSLLLADDVGLGKTVEAGLVLTELLLRRRIRRVLVLTPASLRQQWRDEMKSKFALSFDLVDRQETHQLQKRLGLDANPWCVFPRIIASYHYLRQPDILQQFLATCRADGTGPVRAQLPWDLLVVDEAHNLMPSSFGRDSQLVSMLRTISPFFEHKLFLTATPHNGHTRSFSGLLELLDPVRFTQTSEFKSDERKRVEEVVIRRLKSEINDVDQKAGRPPRFAFRTPSPVPLYFGREERILSAAVLEFRKAVKSLIASSSKAEQLAGSFAIEILTKRLLSGPYTFAESWHRFKAGATGETAADPALVSAAKKAAEEDLEDDQEMESRTQHAVQTVGAWMRPMLEVLKAEIRHVDQALDALGLAQPGAMPSFDERFDRFHRLIEDRLRIGKQWRQDERLILFTEYKTTLDYLEQRLRIYPDHEDRVKVIYGSHSRRGRMNRDKVIKAFNDPDDPVRVLIATDVASEGLNLQETARYVMHWDIPWNPSRLEQRNGRVDRHGQARDVTVFHFASDDDADMHFIAHVVAKVHEIREDLGSVGEVFDAAFERRFVDLDEAEPLLSLLDKDVDFSKGRAAVPRPSTMDTGERYATQLADLAHHVDLSPETLRDTLDVALGIGVTRPRLEGPDARGRMKLRHPLPPHWESLIDDTLRLAADDGRLGPLPQIVFDAQHFIEVIQDRPVFRPSKDTVLLHLGHPLFRHALGRFARLRFPGGDEVHPISRWTCRLSTLPPGMDAMVLLTAEEMAVNDLREPFHHWVRTYRFGVKAGALVGPLPYAPPTEDRAQVPLASDIDAHRARQIWNDVDTDLLTFVKLQAESLAAALQQVLAQAGKDALKEEKERFAHRLKEVQRAMSETSIAKLEKERDQLRQEMQQRSLLAEREREQEARLRNLEEELELRTRHYQELLESLQLEQNRVLDQVLPRRYQLRNQAQVFPVAVEIRLPEGIR